jgi:IclR family acetate operon transcriptional repressor
MRVLEQLSEHEIVGVSELARSLGLPKSSVQRMLLTLKEGGWAVDVRDDTTRWTPTPKMFRLGQRYQAGGGLRATALPVMEKLRQETREAVHLLIPKGDHVVVLECLDSPQPVRVHVTPGDLIPMHASTFGLALLSTQSDEAVQALIDKGLAAFTPSTITDGTAFQEAVTQVRVRGYAASEGLWREGVHAVAAPIIVGGIGIASLGVSTPAHRMNHALEARFGDLVVEAARTLARHIGEEVR